MNLKTISESMQESIIETHALEQNAIIGRIVVDRDGKEVQVAYFEDKTDKVHPLDSSSKLQVVTFDEDSVNYHDISGQDIIDRKNDSGNPLYAGMVALLFD